MAKRNNSNYLSKEEREHALSINKSLKQIEKLYKQGINDSKILFDTALSVLDKDLELEYLEFRDFNTFEQVKEIKSNTLVAIAVKSGKTRLIDNIITE